MKIFVNFILNKIFVKRGDHLFILVNDQEFKYFKDSIKEDDFIITNRCDDFDKCDNIVDIRIFNWLMNNQSDHNFLCKFDIIDYEKIFDEQLKHIKNNFDFFKQAQQYTKYYIQLNKLFEFKINKSYYLRLKEKQHFQQNIINEMRQFDKNSNSNDLSIIDSIPNRIKYTFINSVGKIYPAGNFLQSIDRKKYIDLFKTDIEKQYSLIDFTNFEPAMLYLYTKNKEFIDINFYDRNADRFHVERNEFKNFFLMWLNGAGRKRMGDFYDIFCEYFKDIVHLKNNIKNNMFTNYFGHTMIYIDDYKKLGHLIQSTAYDYLLRFYSYIFYIYNNNSIRFCYNLFDEILIEHKHDIDIKKIFNLSKLNYKIKEL